MDEGQNQIKSPTLRRLKTFTPTLNKNIFYLSQDKLSALDPKSMQGTLIVLSVEVTICRINWGSLAYPERSF